MINMRNSGMTLIELMIVVAIIGILTSIAYPSYNQHVTDTRRKLAQSCLSEFALYMERFYTLNLTYEGSALVPGECVSNLNAGGANYYTFTLSNLAASTFTLTATPLGAQASGDKKCGVALTLNQAGYRGVVSGDDPAKCW